jgi:GTPase
MCRTWSALLRSGIHDFQSSSRLLQSTSLSRYQYRCFGFEYLIDPVKIANEANERKKRDKSKKSARPSYKFIDRSRLVVQGGRGGKGSLSTHILTRKHRIVPDGGHGGNGGSVIIVADPNEQTLTRSHPHVAAGNGENGTSQGCHGASGKNRIVRVPRGVVVKRVLQSNEFWDPVAGTARQLQWETASKSEYIMGPDGEPEFSLREQISAGFQGFGSDDYDTDDDDHDGDDNNMGTSQQEQRRTVILGDLDESGAHLVVAKGGQGGMGTCIFASHHGALPDARYLTQTAQPADGEVVYLELELKLIADIGLVGFPNAGKSSLLRAMSAATPEVAPYPFTTLHPLIGCIEYRDGLQVRAADIPGLIDGASEGRGRGHDFLRHIERTKALLYIVDAAGVDFRNPIDDLCILAKELESYGDGSLMDRRALVVANKVDLLLEEQVADLCDGLRDTAESLGIRMSHDVFAISAGVTGAGLGYLSKAIRDIVDVSEADRVRVDASAM